MGLLHTTAADLPHFVQTHAKVMARVARAESAAGARLRPVFEQFATNHAYAGITFVWLSAADAAPAGSGLVAPFFCTFAQGQLVYGDTLSTEQQVRGVLHALHAHG
jgi:proline racemase